MIERAELAALAKSVGRMVRVQVSNAIGIVTARLDQLDQRIKDIPAGKDGIDGKNGIEGTKGLDGKDGAPGPAGKDGIDGENAVCQMAETLIKELNAS